MVSRGVWLEPGQNRGNAKDEAESIVRVSVHMTQGLRELLKVEKVTGRISVVGRPLPMRNLPNTTVYSTSKRCCNKG